MKRLLGFLGGPWLLSLLGLLALSALVWLLGPLVGFAGREPWVSEESRLITILVLALLWTLNRLRRYALARNRNQAMLDGLAQPAAAQAAVPTPEPGALESAEELATIRARFQEAVAVLKKARLKRHFGRHFLYELPWYVIIGPPGSGKTTALVNSGLEFPLAEQFGKDAVRGVGGTRNCDWWFTNEAVLLDTAGRYTTQDSYQAVDQAAWTGFLGLLRKYRPRRPITGVLVAVAVSELLLSDEAARSQHARAIRQRIEELHQQLGIRFPIYFLFTKCDLVAGFLEFFADLGRDDRAQVWGMTFPLEEQGEGAGVVSRVAGEFDALEHRLNARLVQRLQEERDPQRRVLIYAFPQQFGSLKGMLERFLAEVFQPSRFAEVPMLRGVYFTSGTQEGSPIDRVMGTLAASFGLDRRLLPAFVGHGQSYFLGRLFRDLVFPEAGLAGTNLRFERHRVWLQRGAYAGILVLALLVALAWGTSYVRNQAYVQQVEEATETLRQQVQSLTPDQRDLLATLPVLDAVRGLPGGYGERDAGIPWLMGFGLYQGDKLGAMAQEAYRSLLEQAFLPRLMLRLEDQIRGGLGRPDYLYEALKVYLMFDEPSHFNAENVKAWMALDWEHNLPRQVTSAQRQQLMAHLEAVLETPPSHAPIPLDDGLVQQARTVLLRVPLPERIYNRIKQERLATKIPEFRISEAAGRDAALVFVRKSGKPLNQGIPGLYTYAGYYQSFLLEAPRLVKDLAVEGWILGTKSLLKDPAELDRLVEDVRRLYLQDYIARWEALLGDIGVVSTTSPQQTLDVLRVLSGAESPLRRLLEAVAKEVTLDRPPQVGSGVIDKAAEKVGALRGQLERFFAPDKGVAATSSAAPEAMVTQRFSPLIRLVQHQGDRPAPIDATLALLGELFAYTNAITSAGDRGSAALEAARSQRGGSGILEKVQMEADRLPVPLQGWIKGLAEDSAGHTAGGVRARLNAVWGSTVVPFYREALAGRYPLNRGSRQEATLEDFSTFFGPGGLVDEFFKQQLEPFVDTSGRVWRWRGGSMRLGISDAVLAQLQRAAVIRQAFFGGAGKLPAVSFSLTPLQMDPNVKQFLLDLEGQTLDYRHGPMRPTRLQWPAPQSTGQVRLVMVDVSEARPTITEEGPWAWFRLLDRAQMAPGAVADQFRVTFQVDRYQASFNLAASSVRNPFRLEELQHFYCPERL